MPHPSANTDTAVVHEVLEAIIAQAEFAAHLVHHFLGSLGMVATPDKPTYLPAWFLLDVGTALQIARWERTGAAAFLPDKFPPAMALLTELFAVVGDPERARGRQPDTALAARVMAAHVQHFAHSRRVGVAAVVLSRPEPDALVDALACFLWNTRSTAAPVGAQPGAE